MAKKRNVNQSNTSVNNAAPVTPVTPETMDKAGALELIAGLETARARWIAFDKWVSSQADRPAGITKESVIKGLILEAQGITVPAYDKTTVTYIMTEQVEGAHCLNDDDRRLVDRKYASIKALVSMAYNSGSKSKSKGAATDKTTDKATNTGVAPNFGELEPNIGAWVKSLTDDQLDTLMAACTAEISERKAAASKAAAEKASKAA